MGTTEPHAGDLVTPKIRLVRPLGAGGMGSVWLADHEALHTQVVVKFIASDLAKSRDAKMRFEREASAAAQVKSPHVVQIHDHGLTDAGAPFIVMELLEGQDLAEHLEKFGRLDLEQVGEIVTQLCRALSRAHERGIVHRDIKPHNIFLCDVGDGELFVKLLDFGIAKNVSVEKLSESTKTGTLVGSPYYMSPEQLVGAKDVDLRTDLWSVGVVAFEAMTGTRAFDGETLGALALCVHNEPLPLPSKRCDAANASIDAWFARACARPVAERFSSAKEMADAFLVAITGDPTRESMTSSGSALARSKSKDALGLAKTLQDSGSIDPNAQSYAGVERAPSREKKRRPSTTMIAATALAATVLAYGIVRVARSDHEAHVAPATSIVVSSPQTSQTFSIATAEPQSSSSQSSTVSSAAPPSSASTGVTSQASTSPHAFVLHTSHSASAKPPPSASAAPPPTTAHTTQSEDDIK